MVQHNWIYNDDIVAFYLFRYGFDSLLFDLKSIGKKLGMTPDSMRMRAGNFKFIEVGGGLGHPAQLSNQVFEDYKKVSKSDHYEKVKDILYR